MGGSLYQDIEDHWRDTSAEYHSATRHRTRYALREIYGKSLISIFPPSEHQRLAPNLKVVAHDP